MSAGRCRVSSFSFSFTSKETPQTPRSIHSSASRVPWRAVHGASWSTNRKARLRRPEVCADSPQHPNLRGARRCRCHGSRWIRSVWRPLHLPGSSTPLKVRYPRSFPGATGYLNRRSSSWKMKGSTTSERFWRSTFEKQWSGTCHQPCRGVYVSVPDRAGPTPRGFRCNRLTLDINAAVMLDPAWRVELVRLWLAVADLIRAFYAEIREGECPTKAWWWNGIPTGTPSAVLIGAPYLDLWTTFTEGAKISAGGLAYREQMNQASVAENGHIPVPPEAIVQPPDHRTEIDPSTGALLSVFKYNDIQYPPIWPFDRPKI